MDFNKLNENQLKKFGIKYCCVKLEKIAFSKIRISCVEQTSRENIELKWSLTREDLNTFSLKIKRKLCDVDSNELPAPKRVKFTEVSGNQRSGSICMKSI